MRASDKRLASFGLSPSSSRFSRRRGPTLNTAVSSEMEIFTFLMRRSHASARASPPQHTAHPVGVFQGGWRLLHVSVAHAKHTFGAKHEEAWVLPALLQLKRTHAHHGR